VALSSRHQPDRWHRVVALEENVRESIFIILGTAPGERVQRKDFGCRIHDLMFEPNNYVTAARAEYYCEEALYKYEPRISRSGGQGRAQRRTSPTASTSRSTTRSSARPTPRTWSTHSTCGSPTR
jgi:phage baseplate assembly protein W